VTGHTGHVSLVLALGWLATLLGRQAIPPLLPTISETLGLSSVQVGFALKAMMGLNALVQYPSGRLSDQLTRKSVLVVSLGLTTAGFCLLVASFTYSVFLLGVCLVGIGGGGYFTPARAYLSDLFVEKLGRVYGLQSASGMTGSMLASARGGRRSCPRHCCAVSRPDSSMSSAARLTCSVASISISDGRGRVSPRPRPSAECSPFAWWSRSSSRAFSDFFRPSFRSRRDFRRRLRVSASV